MDFGKLITTRVQNVKNEYQVDETQALTQYGW